MLVAILLAQAIFSEDIPTVDRDIYNPVSHESESAYVPGEVLVRFKKGMNISTLDSIVDSQSIKVERYFNAISKLKGQLYVLLKSKTRTTIQMQADLAKNPDVDYVSPNYIIYADTTPNDPRFNELWGLHNTGQTGGAADVDIDAPEAWAKNNGSQRVIVAVIDTGIDYNHPDLAANMWINPNEIIDGIDNDGNGYIDDIYGINAINHSGDPMDDNGHGTHCSGTIGAAGNNALGVTGVNWNVQLMGTKFLNISGSGSNANAIACIDYIIDEKTTYNQNIVAINASWGGNGFDQNLKDAIDAAGAVGIVFCAAAGNNGTNNDISPHYPSSYTSSNIIAVTAVNHIGTQYYNYGPTRVDLGAPGVSILSTTRCIYTPQPGDIFFDNMESGGSQWIHGGTLDSWSITNAASGGLENYWLDKGYGNFWSDSPGKGYIHNVDNWLAVANDIDLSSYIGQTVYLSFDGGFQFDYFRSNDTAAIEVSIDSGSNWDTLVNLGPLYIGYGYYYLKQLYVIPDAYKTANFRFRFHITTDATDYSYFGYKNRGWLIDNIGIGINVTCDYGDMSGTSMATPHVTGAVALIAAEFPAETSAERITRVLSHILPLESLKGKCVTGGLLNLDLAMGGVLPAITVTSPNGGESWEAGSTHNITWTSTGIVGNVKIEYSTDNGNSWTGIVASTANNGSYSWAVANTQSSNCLVRISETDGSPSDVSNAVFSIFIKPSITITSPNGGEKLIGSTIHKITWASKGTINNVAIDYSTDDGKSWFNIVNSMTNDGSYNWTVPVKWANKSLVRIHEKGANTSLSDVSDAVFSIVSPPVLVISSPNGGEKWNVGSAQYITWKNLRTLSNGFVKIDYSTDNGSSWKNIIKTTRNIGKYAWIVPNTPSANCRIRIAEINGSLVDISDDTFVIAAELHSTITVISPNGGESLIAGYIHKITWTTRGTIPRVIIDYSTNSGSSWSYIVNSTGNSGSYDWVIPNTPSGSCLVRIYGTGDGEVPLDVSDAVFSIVPDTFNCGFQGIAYERKPDGSIGHTIAGVEITFVSEDRSLTKRVITTGSGSYRISLKPFRYWVSTKHPDFEDYSTFPGFFVVTGNNGYQTGNFFLTRK